MKKPVIEIRDLTVAYNLKPVLWDIDINIPKGVRLAISGPNGAGKTTLIKSILNLIKPAAGSILINGQSYKDQKKSIAYVPQRNSVDWDFPANVMDVVLMGRYGHLGWFKRPGKMDKELAFHALERLGMQDYLDQQINELSGGQQQRVFLARALVQEAEIYLLDEPFVGIDALTEKVIVDLFQELKKEKKTLIVVHHNLETIREYYDWLLLLNVRKVAYGPVENILTDENLKITYSGKTGQLITQ